MRLLRLALLVLLSSAPSLAQVRTWVSSQGLDTNTCTRTEPCRNFAAAIAAVASAGEVVALDSAGYGPVMVDKRVSLIAPRGVHAAIAPTTGNAISINGPGAVITVRNLYLNSQGADIGLLVDEVSRLFVESSVISGFSNEGILVNDAAPLFVTDSVIRNNESGVFSVGPVNMDRVQIHGNDTGVNSADSLTLRGSSFSGNGSIGLIINNGVVQSCAFTGNPRGVVVMGIAVISGCTIVGNTNGGIIAIASGSKFYLFNSTVTGNGVGIEFGVGSEISLQNNTIRDNSTDGVMTPMSPN